METSLDKSILQTIGYVYKGAKNCKLTKKYFTKFSGDIKGLSEYFGVSEKQAFMLAIIFMFNFDGNSATVNEFEDYFECDLVLLLDYPKDLETLFIQGFLKKDKSRKSLMCFTREEFYVDKVISQAILNNLPMPIISEHKYEDAMEVIEAIFNLVENRDKEEISAAEMLITCENILEKYLHFSLIKSIKQIGLNTTNRIIFIYIIWRSFTGRMNSDIDSLADLFYEKSFLKMTFYAELANGDNQLLKENCVEIEDAEFYNLASVKLSEKALELLNTENIKLSFRGKKAKNLIDPDKIGAKDLFYNLSEQAPVQMLNKLLQEENFKNLQTRLSDKVMPQGVNVLLHGVSGTGKTETVFQLAKKSDRELMKVEISQTKSMWFGESEKIIKGIFTDYQQFSSSCKRTPILFFNEADAIISKRQENSQSNVGQTENAIQNILLEELENFQGILFATTNLANNLDKAFERRFLFKVEFSLPDQANRAAIWKSKLSCLTENDCAILAKMFSFSGGQIENVARKCEIQEILEAKSINLNQIIAFAEDELLVKRNGNQIGFRIDENNSPNN